MADIARNEKEGGIYSVRRKYLLQNVTGAHSPSENKWG